MHCLCRIRDQPSFALDAVHLPVGISSASIQIFFQCSRCHSAMTFAVSQMEITFKAHLIFTRWLVNLWQNLCRIQSFKDCLVQCVIKFYTPSHNENSQRFPLCQIFYKRDRAIFKREFFLIDIQNRTAKALIALLSSANSSTAMPVGWTRKTEGLNMWREPSHRKVFPGSSVQS